MAKFVFKVTSLSGQDISFESTDDKITAYKLREKISELTPYRVGSMQIFDNGQELKYNDTVDYTNETLYFVAHQNKPFKSREELKNAIKNYNKRDNEKYGPIDIGMLQVLQI